MSIRIFIFFGKTFSTPKTGGDAPPSGTPAFSSFLHFHGAETQIVQNLHRLGRAVLAALDGHGLGL